VRWVRWRWMRAEPDSRRVGKSHLKCENATPGPCRGAMPDGAIPDRLPGLQ